MKLTLNEYDIGEDSIEKIAERIDARGVKLGDRENIGKKEVIEILNICA